MLQIETRHFRDLILLLLDEEVADVIMQHILGCDRAARAEAGEGRGEEASDD